MHILVCGGAGYIGSHMAKLIAKSGYKLTVIDNLSTGHRKALKWGDFIEADIRDSECLDKVFSTRNINAVMHFSAKSLVGESIEKADIYYDNNVLGSQTLIESMLRHNVKKLIFSSTAAVYGLPQSESITEQHPTNPINPYGETKLSVEKLLKQYSEKGLNSVALRYFNAAGADISGDIGEAHDPETHLIPNILKSSINHHKSQLSIFGMDYPTYDGTCIRDYIHVNDLADAHLLALQYLEKSAGFNIFNLGNGKGFSVKEVINCCERVLGKTIPYTIDDPRPGDPPVLVASSNKAQNILGWKPKYTNLDEIIETALKWHKNQSY